MAFLCIGIEKTRQLGEELVVLAEFNDGGVNVHPPRKVGPPACWLNRCLGLGALYVGEFGDLWNPHAWHRRLCL